MGLAAPTQRLEQMAFAAARSPRQKHRAGGCGMGQRLNCRQGDAVAVITLGGPIKILEYGIIVELNRQGQLPAGRMRR